MTEGKGQAFGFTRRHVLFKFNYYEHYHSIAGER